MIDKPNYTQIPNIILDDFIMCMGDAEFKVVLAIARQTFGYHRARHKISLAELRALTGLSRQGVINGVTAGMERGVIDREADGDSWSYAIVINDSASQRNGLVHEVDQGSPRNGLEVVHEVDQYTPVLKKELKKDLKKEERKKDAATQPTPQQEMFGAICEAVGWDYNVLSKDDKGQVAQLCGILNKHNYTVDDIRRFITEFWFKDWRWKKSGKPPTLKQLRQEIGIIRSVMADAAPKQKRTGIEGYRDLAKRQGITI